MRTGKVAQRVTEVLTLQNRASASVTNVTLVGRVAGINGPLPSSITVVSSDASLVCGPVVDGAFACTAATMSANKTVSLTVAFTPSGRGAVRLTTTASTTSAVDPLPKNNTLVFNTVVSP